MNAISKTYISPEDYLERERKAEYKSEYYDGEIFAMAGAGPEHVIINTNLIAHLHIQLRGRDCTVLGSDMRLHIPQAKGLYTYPDVSVVCGKSELDANLRDNLMNPVVIFEILSDSTAEYDRTTKFEMYSKINSLREYILVEQKRPFVQIYTKSASGDWIYSSVSDMQGSLFLQSINCTIPLTDIYEKITFEEAKIRAIQDKSF